MKLVINQTKKESFLFDNDKVANLRVAYSFVKKSYNNSWNFTNDEIKIREYTKIDFFVDKITGKKHLTY